MTTRTRPRFGDIIPGTPLTITAVINGPMITGRYPLMLDGPLAWAAWADGHNQGAYAPPITPEFAYDFPLPLASVDVDDYWIWCTSRGIVDELAQTATQIRRKPAIEAMARYGKDRKHHAGLGPFKARDTTLPLTIARTVTWQAIVTDETRLSHLLGLITHLGPRHRNGFGAVQEWRLDPGTPDGWRDRHMPHPDGVPIGIRAPYWHASRRAACL